MYGIARRKSFESSKFDSFSYLRSTETTERRRTRVTEHFMLVASIYYSPSIVAVGQYTNYGMYEYSIRKGKDGQEALPPLLG